MALDPEKKQKPELRRHRRSAYKRRNPANCERLSMDAVYMIVAFLTVMVILNVVTTGRVD